MDTIGDIFSSGKIWLIILGILIIGAIVTYVVVTTRSKIYDKKHTTDDAAPFNADMKLADPKYKRSSSPGWDDIPALINSETISQELGWALEKYKTYQDNQRKEVLTAVPDFGNELHPKEIIIRWMKFRGLPLVSVSGKKTVDHYWNILLTDKRILYKVEKKIENRIDKQWVASHWYESISIQEAWQGDLGSHVEGGGGYVSGWIFAGMGSIYGEQKAVKTVRHYIDCTIIFVERNGERNSFPFPPITNKETLTAVKDFAGMLNKLVNLAWKRTSIESPPTQAELPAPQKRIESPAAGANNRPSGEKDVGDFDKRAATLEKYAALKGKGLITEEEYNQQKKKILNQ